MIEFSLPVPYKLPNTYLGRNRFSLMSHRNKTKKMVVASGGSLVPNTPFKYAKVEIIRYSTGIPDRDNLYAGSKPVLDCLTTPVKLKMKNPEAPQRWHNKNGLGFIVDDDPKHCFLICKAVKCKRCDQKTLIRIIDLSEMPAVQDDYIIVQNIAK